MLHSKWLSLNQYFRGFGGSSKSMTGCWYPFLYSFCCHWIFQGKSQSIQRGFNSPTGQLQILFTKFLKFPFLWVTYRSHPAHTTDRKVLLRVSFAWFRHCRLFPVNWEAHVQTFSEKEMRLSNGSHRCDIAQGFMLKWHWTFGSLISQFWVLKNVTYLRFCFLRCVRRELLYSLHYFL